MSRLSAAQPIPQAKQPAAAAGANESDAAAAVPPARKARRNAPKETRKKTAIKGKRTTATKPRTRAKKPRKIPSVHMDHPDWPWPLDLCMLRYPIWMQQMNYKENRKWYRKTGETGPSEEYRAAIREWKAEHGF